MQGAIIIAFLAGTFVGMFSFYVSRIMIKAKVPEMCHKECERIKELKNVAYNLNSENVNIDKKLMVAIQERDIAINHSKETLRDRNKKFKEIINKVTRL